ncbi:IclR family transcriptional regulator [Rhodococcus ruber]|uniref:IclR family transcriptional regulator n=1 Tax=Rhodococcus ruber TaxID=1830 RepID=UPI000E6AEEA6|nr:IclR family transcriptional regulator [Rhodococcus ruber]AXY54040.1 IclR family transcriptional regulator [Rhodococcus ruber]RQM36058.1 IclR family transcriptional regulator [Rhodococcus ruber]UQB72161.1 IclR family transcriptional regulator [Rhodococcus ruber]WKK10215.1 IclR family transcriptional regulator [Rhodococcus ruber]
MAVVEATEPTATTAPRRDVPPSMVERMTLILDAFEGRSSRLTLEEVACRTRLPRSTVHRILDQLVKLNWVDHASFGYCLGRRALGLGGGDGGHGEIRASAAPLLHELHMQTGMVVHLAVLDGAESVYLDKVGGRFAAALPSRVGGRAPAYTTAGGKAMLAWLEPERVDDLYERRLARRTEHTIGDLAILHQELSRIRQRRGLSFERSESVRGVACVAVAVRGHDGPVAAISLCGDARTAQLERVAPLVVDTAREVSRSLYPELGAPRRGRRAPEPPESTWSPDAMDRLLSVQSGQWL